MIQKITLALAFTFCVFASNAQLSGTYTIGGSSPDYASVTAAKNDLIAQGVNGAVVFNMRDGVYNEQVNFTSVAGASATNTITFQAENGDSSLVVLEYASNTVLNPNYTIGLSGCSYINFHQLTIRRTGTNNSARVVEFIGGASFNSFTNCALSNEIITGSAPTACIIGSNSGTVDNNNSVANCLISGGSFGIYWYGGGATNFETGNTFTNNQIVNSTTRGAFLNYQTALVFSGNEINTNSTSATFYGIGATACEQLSIVKNKINCPAGGYGIQVSTSTAMAGSEGSITNNFIAVQGTAQAYGINLNTVDYYNVYYNSINVTSTDPANGRAMILQNTGSSNLNILNNNIVNTGGGYAVYFDAVTNAIVSQMNYNNIFSTGNNKAYYNGINCLTLATWQSNSGLDANSVSFNPQYVSATDLHMPPVVVNDFGTPITGLTDDIDGELRNVFSPDIGADEYAPYGNDLAITEIFEPRTNACGSDSTMVGVIVRNYGFNDQSNFDLQLNVTGGFTANETYTYTNTLLAGQKDTVYFTTLINTLAGGNADISVVALLAGDQYSANDTVNKSVTFFGIPAAPVMATPNPNPVCANNPVTLDGTVGPTEDILFFDAPVGGNIIHVGHPWTTQFPASTTVYAEARSVTSGIPCLRFTEVELNDAGGEGDYVEVQNLTLNQVDATGWVVASSDSYTDANLVNATLWNLDVFAPGEIKYKCDACASTPNYWGQNLLYSGGQPGWIIMLDNTGAIVDFMAWGWDSTEVQNMNIVVNGFNITIGSNWLTTGAQACSTGSISRLGSADNDADTDWACEPNTKGIQNANITNPFAACGIGLCGSERVAVSVSVVGTAVNLGPDTAVTFPNTVTLDAGNGFTTYQWSTGANTQTIVVSNSGIFTVTVTDANGCTSSDEIIVTVFTGNIELSSDQVNIHPNPANDILYIDLNDVNAIDNLSISIYDNMGRLIQNTSNTNVVNSFNTKFDLSSISKGLYTIRIIADSKVYQQLFVKQ